MKLHEKSHDTMNTTKLVQALIALKAIQLVYEAECESDSPGEGTCFQVFAVDKECFFMMDRSLQYSTVEFSGPYPLDLVEDVLAEVQRCKLALQLQEEIDMGINTVVEKLGFKAALTVHMCDTHTLMSGFPNTVRWNEKVNGTIFRMKLHIVKKDLSK